MEKLVTSTIFVIASVAAVTACVVTSLTPVRIQRFVLHSSHLHNNNNDHLNHNLNNVNSDKRTTSATTTVGNTSSSTSSTKTTTTTTTSMGNSCSGSASSSSTDDNTSSNLGCLPSIPFCRPTRSSTTTEPGFWKKQTRRWKVFRIAIQIYLEYRVAKKQSFKLQKQIKKEIAEQQQQETSMNGATSTTPINIDVSDHNHPKMIEFWSCVHRRNAIRLTQQIKVLQGFWVKVGQFLSSRADVMPNEYIIELSSLQDSLPSKPLVEIRQTLQEEWGLLETKHKKRKKQQNNKKKRKNDGNNEHENNDDEDDDDNSTTRHQHRLQQLEALLESMDPEPLSTASLAQVHRARIPLNTTTKDSGNDQQQQYQEVVLKVQHKGIASLMRQDMENLRLILGILARLEPDFDFEPVFREYNVEVEKELNFQQEAFNMEEVRTILQLPQQVQVQQSQETSSTTATTATTSTEFNNNKHSNSTTNSGILAIIPRVLQEYTTERVLVMEFCQGFAVREVEQMEQHHVNKALLLERICSAWAMQMHVGGFFNADPHMGNILVSTDLELTKGDTSVPVLLDFGLTKRFTPSMKLAFARLMHASDEHDIDALVQSFEEMGLKWRRDKKDQDPFEDMANLQASLRNTVPQEEAKQATQQRQTAFEQRREAKRQEAGLPEGQTLRNPVEAWPAELVFFGRVTNLLKGLCSRLGVRYPYLYTMAQAARKTLREAVPSAERAIHLIHPSSTTTTTSPTTTTTPSGDGDGSSMTAEDDTPCPDNLHRRLVEAIQQLDQESQMVGLQLVVRHHGSEVVNLAAGVLGTANPRPMTPQSLINIFSVSKALLSLGVLRLVQDGAIESLDDSVSKYWPAFVGKDGITIRHALAHQAGLANSMPGDATLDTLLDWKGMKQFLAKHAIPEHPPGTQTTYHYLTYCWLCGGLIEGVTGKPYEDYLNELLEQHQITPNDLHVGGLPDDVQNKDLAILSVLREIGMDYTTESGVDNDTREKEEMETTGISSGETETLSTKSTDSTDSSDKKKDDTDKDGATAVQDGTPAENTQEESAGDKNYKKVLAKYQGQKHLLNPSIFNMRKVRASKVPSANVHASAASLAAVLDSLNRPKSSANGKSDSSPGSFHGKDATWFGALLDPHMVDQARQPQPLASVSSPGDTSDTTAAVNKGRQQQLLDDSDAYFGLGFQVHEFSWRGGTNNESKGSSPRKLLSLGHAGLGGSVVLTLPEIPLTVAFTSNQLDRDGKARNKLLEIVFDEFGLHAPTSMR